MVEGESNEQSSGREVWESWLSPRQAVLSVAPFVSGSEERAATWLLARLVLGQLEALAASVMWMEGLDILHEEYAKIPDWLWGKCIDLNCKHDFWLSGDYERKHNAHGSDLDHGRLGNEGWGFISCARFSPESLRILIEYTFGKSPEPAPVDAVRPSALRGGRPPKPFWDEMWAAIAAQLYNGDLKPKRQVDVEKAIHEWLATNGEEAGQTVVRAKAKQLWEAINTEVAN